MSVVHSTRRGALAGLLAGTVAAILPRVVPAQTLAFDSAPRRFFSIGDAIIGSGRVKNEVRNAGNFHRVRLRSFVDLELVAGTQERVTLHGDDNLLPYIDTTLENGELVISQRSGSLRTRQRMHVKVEYRQLDAVSAQGSGDVYAADLKADDLQIASSGSGDIIIDQLQAHSLMVSIAGSGNFQAGGRANVQAFSIVGSGDIGAEGLSGESVGIEIAGSGDARVHASGKLAVSIAGSGSVRYRGKPQIVKRITGSGSVSPMP